MTETPDGWTELNFDTNEAYLPAPRRAEDVRHDEAMRALAAMTAQLKRIADALAGPDFTTIKLP